MVSLVTMLVGGVGLTKEVIGLIKFVYDFATLCSLLETKNRLFHPMDIRVAIFCIVVDIGGIP